MVDIEFDTIPLRFGLGSMLKIIDQLSSEDIDNAALPPLPALPSYLIARDRSIGERYEEADLLLML